MKFSLDFFPEGVASQVAQVVQQFLLMIRGQMSLCLLGRHKRYLAVLTSYSARHYLGHSNSAQLYASQCLVVSTTKTSEAQLTMSFGDQTMVVICEAYLLFSC